MPIFDTHAHFNLEPLFSGKDAFHFKLSDEKRALMNWQKCYERAIAVNVTHLNIVGASVETSRLALEIKNSGKKNLYASVGIHPEELLAHLDDESGNAADTFMKQSWQQLLLLDLSKADAIGETGLDFFRLDLSAEKLAKLKIAEQNLFIKHLELANSLEKPLVVHMRSEKEQDYFDLLDLIKKHYQFKKPFVLHCVSGPAQYVKKALELGAYIGFDGNLTFKNNQALIELWRMVPTNRILLETDSPFLAPVPNRGQICEPAMIADTAIFAATTLDANLDQIFNNSLAFFS